MKPITKCIPIVLLLAACDTSGSEQTKEDCGQCMTPAMTAFSYERGGSTIDPGADPALGELLAIQEDLVRRMHRGGHSAADLQEAADAGDVPRIREILGLSSHDYASYQRRFTIAAERFLEAHDPPRAPGRHGPPSPRDDLEIEEDGDCFYVGLAGCTALAAKLAAGGGPVGWILAALAMQQCLCANCWGGITVHICPGQGRGYR